MPRIDLLALSLDDLATLANRGLVKRASSELDQFTATISENAAGTVSVLWSDDVHCLLPSGAPLQSAKCSCSSAGLCRHLIRSVLAYQREHTDAAALAETPSVETPSVETPSVETPSAAATPVESPSVAVSDEARPDEGPATAISATVWNPAEITDELLSDAVAAATLQRARRLWNAGQVIEVTVGTKPTARFHTLSTNTRFMVRGDLRYTHCDCSEPAPCVHVPLAVWAFRDLTPETSHGLISTATTPPGVPHATLDALENTLLELVQIGVSSAGQPFMDKLKRLEKDCRQAGLIWPAAIVTDLWREVELHASHNARFEPVRVVQLAGELLLRSDAIRSQSGAIPDAFVRGAASDSPTDVGAARLIGIGTQAQVFQGGVKLRAFMQDTDSGALVYIAREFPDPEPSATQTNLSAAAVTEPAPLWRLGASPVIKGTGLGPLGAGQVLARGGKRASDGEFSFGRTPFSFNFQNFEWEKLRAPLLVEDFDEIEARLSEAPPAALRPRRTGEDIFVVPIQATAEARFASAEQEVHAILRNHSNGSALLVHPFTSRGAIGAEALLAHLKSEAKVCFIAGHFRRSAVGLQVAPLGLVYHANSKRFLVQPWVQAAEAKTASIAPAQIAVSPPADPIEVFVQELNHTLGELWLLGFERADSLASKEWTRLAGRGAGLGFGRLMTPINSLSEELERKAKVRHWNSQLAKAALLELTAMAPLLAERI